MTPQHTIQHTVHCFGTGLHNGKPVSLALHPAPEDTGIIFVRSDIKGNHNEIIAAYHNVSATTLGTTITNDHSLSVATIEHLMAAIWGCGVDNMYIELHYNDAGSFCPSIEVPALDGSSEPYVFLIECAHVIPQSKARTYIDIQKKISLELNNASLTIEPATQFSIDLEIRFDSKAIATQKAYFDETAHSFKMDVCRARTFGFVEEVDKLKQMGLGLGGSLDNVIVISGDTVLNEGGLRYTNEFVRHKILDCIGDLFLGGRLRGAVKGVCSGHTVNNKLLRTLFSDASAWSASAA